MGGGSLKIRTPVHFTISSSCKKRKRIKNIRNRTKKGGNHSTINIGKRIQNIQQFWTIKNFLEFLKNGNCLKVVFDPFPCWSGSITSTGITEQLLLHLMWPIYHQPLHSLSWKIRAVGYGDWGLSPHPETNVNVTKNCFWPNFRRPKISLIW